MKQGLILFLQVQFFQNSAQNPNLPLDCLVGALDRQEHHLSFASGCWRAGLEGNSTVNELLCMKSQPPFTKLDFHKYKSFSYKNWRRWEEYSPAVDRYISLDGPQLVGIQQTGRNYVCCFECPQVVRQC